VSKVGEIKQKRDKNLIPNKPKLCQKVNQLIWLCYLKEGKRGTGTDYSDILWGHPPEDPKMLRFTPG
jgi:hypothetical protein